MTDGNTYAINKYLDEREDDYDELQEVKAELEQAEARIEELEAKLAKAVDASVEAVWAEYTDSIESKWAFRKEHVQNAIARTLAELKEPDDE